MRVYRISEKQFAADLSGDGARIGGGRWNPKGVPMLYTAESVALAALEVLVRISTRKHYYRTIFQVPDTASMEVVDVADLPTDWQVPYPNRHLIEYGRNWVLERRSLLLKVPSAVINGEGWNFLINPLHDDFLSVVILDIAPFPYDCRLIAEP